MNKIPFKVARDGRCLTPCPYGHITKKQIEESDKSIYLGSSPYVYSWYCCRCEFYVKIRGKSLYCKYNEEVCHE